MATARTDIYWRGIQLLTGLFIGSFVLAIAADMIQPGSAEMGFNSYPLYSTFLSISTFLLMFGAIPFGYFASKDKRELAKEFSKTRTRHWITLTILTYLSVGLYPLWFLFARASRTSTSSGTDSDGSDGMDETRPETPLEKGAKSEESPTNRGVPVSEASLASYTQAVTPKAESQGIPTEIPSAPDVTVEYDALTNKEPIGGGGNADVTKAKLPTSAGNLPLAIKEPRLSGTLHADQIERMLTEAETWNKLDDHDHIVDVVDYGSEPLPWIAMEYMDGGHLGDRAAALDTPQALWTAIAVTKGVRHAHRRGVAHLDLKPENILFRTVEDGWDVPKVADWGLSKHLLNHSKSVDGLSPQYAAPEQFSNEYGPADDLTDVYQLGAVFYELFTGQPPVEGPPTEAMHQILHESPTPPSDIAAVPEALDDVLLTALATDKADRYESVLLLRNDLQAIFDDE